MGPEMDKDQKSKLRKGLKIGALVTGSASVGFLQGAGIEAILVDQITHAATKGDYVRAAGYVLIFLVIWLEVRGLKKEVAKINSPEGFVAQSFAKGEERFESIESHISTGFDAQALINQNVEHRLTVIEQNNPRRV